MSILAAKKCVRHAGRESVARCPACGEHFCRECVVEHDGALLCAPCLARAAAAKPVERRAGWSRLGQATLTVLSILLLWVVFYGFGQFLGVIPAKVHEGTVWRPDQS